MSELYIKTTQNVPLFFTPASIGERMLAYLVDWIILAAYFVTIYYILFFSGALQLINTWDNWSQMAVYLVFYAPAAFYPLVCESTMEGQTLGKKMIKIKVVKIDGYQASFTDYFTRWIFRLVDIGLMYIPGVITMLFSKHTQRLGDLAAGTAVITEKSKYNISHTILADITDDYTPVFSPSQIMRFNDNDMRIIKENSHESVKTRDNQLMNKLLARMEEVMQVKNPYPSPSDFVQKVIEDYNYYTGK